MQIFTYRRVGYSSPFQTVNTELQDILLKTVIFFHLLVHDGHPTPSSVNLKGENVRYKIVFPPKKNQVVLIVDSEEVKYLHLIHTVPISRHLSSSVNIEVKI